MITGDKLRYFSNIAHIACAISLVCTDYMCMYEITIGDLLFHSIAR